MNIVIDAKVHPFDPAKDVRPLYRDMLEKGMLRLWRNPASDASHFEPGGLDLTDQFNAVRRDGSIDTRLAFLGMPTEGMLFFQLGTLRPNQNYHVMKDILQWFNPLSNQL